MGASRCAWFLLAASLAGQVCLRAQMEVFAESSSRRVTLDLTCHGEKISKYIYGQFVEHLGRCIYGGIWAEMLEDRKFFYPLQGDKEPWEVVTPGPTSWEGSGVPFEVLTRSPWLVVGTDTAVRMVREGAYVGEHTPEIRLTGDGQPCGIYQERLALVEGRKYVGRVVLAGGSQSTPIEVTLVWASGDGGRQTCLINEVSDEFSKVEFDFVSGATTSNGRLEIVGRGNGTFRVGAVSLMPSDNVNGFRCDTLKLMRELGSPVYRWPGGNFVSGYDWKDGIGDPDRRPPRKNPAWKGVEHNDVGIHEFISLCRELGAEPFIVLNSGLGGVDSARMEVEYVDGPPDSPMGSWRAVNGEREPFDVKWWGLGNEMYGDWQLGHMPLREYVKKHNRMAEAVRSVAPAALLVTVGRVGDWTRAMLSECADHMDLIGEHFYVQEKEDLMEHVAQVPLRIRAIAEAHREYRGAMDSLSGKDIRIAIDEYNYWYGGFVYGELGTRYFLKDALGIAAGIHEFVRNSDLIFMANYAQTVNVIGSIKTTPTAAEFATTGLVLKLYRNYFGTIPVALTGDCFPLDVQAAMTENRRTLTVAIVNPTSKELQLTLNLKGGHSSEKGHLWVVTGPHAMAYNEPGKERRVDLVDHSITVASNTLGSQPLSISLYALPMEPSVSLQAGSRESLFGASHEGEHD